MTGESVTIFTKVPGAKDAFGDETYTDASETVDNVLVSPQAGTEIDDSIRPDGVIVKYRLDMPKSWAYAESRKSLHGAEISVRGHRLRVIGDPDAYTVENTPTDWCMPVYVTEAEG
jgi:hypothetical protein